MAGTWTVERFRKEVIPVAVMPPIRLILSPAEFGSLEIDVVDVRDDRANAARIIGENELILCVTVLGETSRTWLFEPHFEVNYGRRFYNDLQDFVSESIFGWGQLRGPVVSLDPHSDA